MKPEGNTVLGDGTAHDVMEFRQKLLCLMSDALFARDSEFIKGLSSLAEREDELSGKGFIDTVSTLGKTRRCSIEFDLI